MYRHFLKAPLFQKNAFCFVNRFRSSHSSYGNMFTGMHRLHIHVLYAGSHYYIPHLFANLQLNKAISTRSLKYLPRFEV